MIRAHILPESTIYTDEAPGYDRVTSLRSDDGKPLGYQHRQIHHASKVYVVGDVHTNNIEGFWSLIKRGIGETHHAVSQKFLQSYLDEYVFRYNRRNVEPSDVQVDFGEGFEVRGGKIARLRREWKSARVNGKRVFSLVSVSDFFFAIPCP
jgi:transposase-like protein